MILIEKLAKLQKELKAPKGQFNKFGNYKYRSCEDILESVKPLLPSDCILIVNDDIHLVADRVYVKATATFTDGKDTISATAYAREALVKKGMDDSQITGSASSYARKYALNGLLLIDDTKDADTRDNSDKPAQNDPEHDLRSAKTLQELQAAWNKINAIYKKTPQIKQLAAVKEQMKAKLSEAA